MLDREQIENWDFVAQEEKKIDTCPTCKVKYERHAWSPGGNCAPCSNAKKGSG